MPVLLRSSPAGAQPVLNRASGLTQDLRFLARLTMPVGQGWNCLASGVPVGGASNPELHYNASIGIGSVASGTAYQADDPRLGPCYSARGAGTNKGLSWPKNGGSGSDDAGGRALRLSGNTGTFVVRHAVAYLSADDIVFCHPHTDGSTWAQPYVTWAMKRHTSDYRGQLFLATSGSTSATVASASAFWDATSSDFSPLRWRTYAIVRDGDSVRFLRFAHTELGSGTVTELDETSTGAGTQDWVYRDSPECGIYLGNTKYWADNGTGFTSMAAVYDRPLGLAELAQIHATPERLWTQPAFRLPLVRPLAAGGVSGAAALAGVGSLTVVGMVSTPGVVALAGTGNLAVVGAVSTPGAVVLAGTGTLTVAATVTTPGAAALSGTGTLTAIGMVSTPGAVAMAGSGTLAVTGSVSSATQVALSGTGTLTAVGTVSTPGVVALVGSGTLAVVGTVTSGSQASLSGSGTLTVAATVTTPGAATLTGSGTLAATGMVSTPGVIAMAATGTMTVAGTVSSIVAVTLNGSGTLTVTAHVTIAGAVTLTGTGTLTATGTGTVRNWQWTVGPPRSRWATAGPRSRWTTGHPRSP